MHPLLLSVTSPSLPSSLALDCMAQYSTFTSDIWNTTNQTYESFSLQKTCMIAKMYTNLILRGMQTINYLRHHHVRSIGKLQRTTTHTSTLFGYDLIAILRPIDNSLMLSWERNKCDVNCEMYKPETSNLVTLGTMCSKTTFNCSLFVVNWVFVTSNSRLVRFSSSWTLRNSLLVTIGAAVSQKGACKSAPRTHTHTLLASHFSSR